MSKEPIQPQDKYVLRMPDGMRDRIKRAAEKNNRSMNAEIVAALEEAYPNRFTITDWMDKWIPLLVGEKDPFAFEKLKEKAIADAEGTGFRPEINIAISKSGDIGPEITFRPYDLVKQPAM